MKVTPSLPRRRFLTTLVAGAAAIPLMRIGAASAGDLPHLSPSDAQAKTFGYVDEASTIDQTKETAYKAGSRCASCQLYQGDRKAAWGPCAIFPGKAVKTTGWCRSYVPVS
ncbi:MAG: high-potential iron-sulfur protein [Gammaproteobacteria bacterium]|nr:high-potential iron-sulfur protein [Gammaproteobacteria bacterium]